MDTTEADILYARGAFPEIQLELSAFPSRRIDGLFSCGWYGTAINDERGSFCIVNSEGPLAEMVGEYLRVYYLTKDVALYCVESHAIPYDLAITRRAYFELASLWTPYLNVRVATLVDSQDAAA